MAMSNAEAVKLIADRAIAANKYIKDTDFVSGPKMRDTGDLYIAEYNGDNNFMLSLKRARAARHIADRGYFNYALSDRQYAAALRHAVDLRRAELTAEIGRLAALSRDKIPTAAAPSVAPAEALYMDLRSSADRLREDATGTTAKPLAPADASAIVQVVPNGYYTVVTAERHYTIRIANAPASLNQATGMQVASVLTGSDNEESYSGFAFVAGRSVTIWKKYYAGYTHWKDALAILLGDPLKAGAAYTLETTACFVCGRLLSVPHSIQAGIGPVCAEKIAAMGYTFNIARYMPAATQSSSETAIEFPAFEFDTAPLKTAQQEIDELFPD